MGAPLGMTKSIDADGVEHTKNEVGGCSIVQAESRDAAVKLFGADYPHMMMPGGWIEVTEIVPVLGM